MDFDEATGKSTLLHELTRRRPDFAPIDESYYRLLESGHAFAAPPTVDDYEQMFDDAIATFHAPYAQFVAFDRSPANYLAYLVALQPGISLADRVASTAIALATIDLVVFVPIERHDVIATREMPRPRGRVDALLREMLANQTWGFVVPVIEVQGTPSERADLVVNYL